LLEAKQDNLETTFTLFSIKLLKVVKLISSFEFWTPSQT
jgi:hypothetical protein